MLEGYLSLDDWWGKPNLHLFFWYLNAMFMFLPLPLRSR